MSTPSPLEANAYSVTYRLLGDPVAARSAARTACASVAAAPDFGHHWLYPVIDRAVGAAVDAASADDRSASSDDPSAGLRAALRRRLVNATPDERVAGAMVHLAGYPPDFTAEVLRTTPEAAASAAAVLAPPPGVHYRDLGDPALTGGPERRRSRRPRRVRRPHWTTVAAVAIVAAAVIAATQVTGPRPTLGPPLEEGGLAPTHLNGGPLTQATKD